MKKFLVFLTFFLTTLGGGNLAWAEETYSVTGDTGNNTINTASGTTSFNSSTFSFSATSSVNLSVDGGSSYWTLSADRITGLDNSASITITPSQSGLLVVNLVKNNGGNKYLVINDGTSGIQVKSVTNNGVTATYSSSKGGYNIDQAQNSSCPIVVTINATASTSYTLSFTNSSFSNWSFTGFSFTPAITTINVSDLNYSVGPYGKADAGLNRTVGGFNLAFDKGSSSQGVKYNGGSSLVFLSGANGQMTVSMDSNNSSINITRILLNINSYADASTYLSVLTGGGALSKVSDTQLQWTGTASSVTFSHSTSDGTGITLNSMVVSTSAAPSFTKVTPTVTLSPSSATIKVGTADTYSPTTTSTPANFAWTWSHTDLTSTNITYAVGNAGSSDVGDAGSFTTTASSVAGTYSMSATFNGTSNPWFNSATFSNAYTLTVASPIASTPNATVQSYPYTWNFANGSSTWGNSSTQLPASDWEGTGTYYHYNVPNSETGFNIDAIKGLRFQNIGYLGLDWSWGHVYLTGGTITIPSVTKGMIIKINASDNGQSSSATITPTNATYSGDGTATVTNSYQDFTFVATATGAVSFAISGVASIKSISVLKNDLTTFAFNNTETYYGESGDSPSGNNQCTGEFIGRTTTFKYKVGRSQVLRTRVDVAPGFSTTGITVNPTNFGLSSSASAVLDASSYSVNQPNNNDNKIWYWSVQVKKPGTASLTYRFNGTDAYNAKDYTELFTIEKDDPVLEFISSFLIKKVGDANFTRSLKLNGLSLPFTDDNAGTVNVTHSSDNTSVATVNPTTGEVTIGTTPGVANIKVTLAATDYNNKVEKSWKLIVNPESGTDPVLSWNDNVSNVSVPYNNTVTHTATVNTNQKILYSSNDPSIATVDENGVVTGTGIGSTQIYAYVDPTSEYNAVQIEYTVTVTKAGDLDSFRFIPNNGKVNNGKSITPKLVFPTIPGDGVTSLKVTKIQVLERNGSPVSESALTADDAIAACDIIGVDNASNLKDNWILNADGKVNKVNVTINGKTVGKAEITVTFTSTYYNTATATYTVEVTDASTRNFSWADSNGSPEYYTYAGDFMMLPAITGNSNGNNNFSNGAKNSKSYSEGGSTHSALHAYVYERKNGTIKWNEKNLKIGEGFPDFEVINGTGSALMFFSKGQGSSHADSLMVFCETEGDVTLRAYDPQDHAMYCDATIHILPVANLASAETSAGVTFPYTWDFTTNFDMASLAGNNEHYWIPMKSGGEPTGAYTNGLGFFDIDWADVNSNGKTDERNYKYFVAGASNSNVGYMPQFNGMKIKLQGTSSYANKIDRLRILNYEEGKGRLQFSGGDHILYLPLPDTKPSTYRVYVRAEGVGTSYVYINEDASTKQTIPSGTPTILYFESSAISGDLRLSFNNARVYWIACSTEPKNVVCPTSTNSNLKYASASYSYNEDLDLSKSGEVNDGVTAYYASSYSYNAKAEATGTEGFAVVLTPITTKVPANTGLILKKNTTNASTSCYMIANGKNESSYEAPTALTTNYLKATPTAGGTISSTETKDQTTYTNFTMAYAYKMYRDPTDAGTAYTDYLFDRDWSFYRIMGNVSFSGQKSYLQIPGNLYVNKDGEIVVAGSRRATSDNRPSTKAMLDIIYEDEPLNDSGTTGISIVSDQEAFDNDGWYTLQGVRVNTPAKGGIYIHHGKKYVIK